MPRSTLEFARIAGLAVAIVTLVAACGRTLPGPETLTLACINSDLGTTGTVFREGTTASGFGEFEGSCGGANGEEQVYLWTAPATGVYDIVVQGQTVDPVVYLRDSACNGPEVACATAERGEAYIRVHVEAGVQAVIVVDSNGTEGTYTLSIVPDLG